MDESQILDHLEEVNAVATFYMQGKNETEIGRELDIPKAKVSRLLKEWKSMAANNEAVRSRAREALAGADQHYGQLIKQAYQVVEDMNTSQMLNGQLTTQEQTVKLNALKLISDFESKRMDMLHRAGLLENKELADQLMETERKQELLMAILKEVSGQCSHCKPQVLRRLSDINKEKDEATVIYE